MVHTSKRREIKELIRTLKETNPFVEANIMKSVENVNLDACLGCERGSTPPFLRQLRGGRKPSKAVSIIRLPFA